MISQRSLPARVKGRLPSLRARARVAQLEKELAVTRRKLRKARARTGTPKGHQDLDYVFIVTYGRSGSTLLQGVLNSIPGYLIRGENAQILRHLYDFHRSGTRQRARWQRWREHNPDHDELPTTQPFYGMDKYPHQPVMPHLRHLAIDCLLGPEDDTRVLGFKEVHWEQADARRYIFWLRKVFPGARFVFNTRDLDAVAKSAWWGDDPDARQKLEDYEARLLAIADDLGDSAFHVRYDDYVKDPTALRGLFEWLGEEFDVERVTDVLAVKHSFQRAPRPPSGDQTSEADAPPGDQEAAG